MLEHQEEAVCVVLAGFNGKRSCIIRRIHKFSRGVLGQLHIVQSALIVHHVKIELPICIRHRLEVIEHSSGCIVGVGSFDHRALAAGYDRILHPVQLSAVGRRSQIEAVAIQNVNIRFNRAVSFANGRRVHNGVNREARGLKAQRIAADGVVQHLGRRGFGKVDHAHVALRLAVQLHANFHRGAFGRLIFDTRIAHGDQTDIQEAGGAERGVFVAEDSLGVAQVVFVVFVVFADLIHAQHSVARNLRACVIAHLHGVLVAVGVGADARTGVGVGVVGDGIARQQGGQKHDNTKQRCKSATYFRQTALEGCAHAFDLLSFGFCSAGSIILF